MVEARRMWTTFRPSGIARDIAKQVEEELSIRVRSGSRSVRETRATEFRPLGSPGRRAQVQLEAHGPKYLIRTFGCQMNEHDSERIGGVLGRPDGMTPTQAASARA